MKIEREKEIISVLASDYEITLLIIHIKIPLLVHKCKMLKKLYQLNVLI